MWAQAAGEAAGSGGGWAFAAAVVALITNVVILAGLYVRQGRQGRSVEQINRAVNHQEPGESTLIERVVTVERRTEEIARDTVDHRKWEHRVFGAIANHIGLTLPHREDDDVYHLPHE